MKTMNKFVLNIEAANRLLEDRKVRHKREETKKAQDQEADWGIISKLLKWQAEQIFVNNKENTWIFKIKVKIINRNPKEESRIKVSVFLNIYRKPVEYKQQHLELLKLEKLKLGSRFVSFKLAGEQLFISL